jgi:amino acid permease
MVWHYWIAPALVIPALLITVAMVVTYLRKTQAPKYPGDR